MVVLVVQRFGVGPESRERQVAGSTPGWGETSSQLSLPSLRGR